MILSRVTFARIDAAAIDKHLASPLIIIVLFALPIISPTKSHFPSISAWSISMFSDARARFVASFCAYDIPNSSHSWFVACPMLQWEHQLVIASYSDSLSFSLSAFESRTL